ILSPAVAQHRIYLALQDPGLRRSSDPEARHQRTLAASSASQFIAEPGILPGLGGGLVGEQGDVADTAVDLLGYGALLLGGAGDLLAHGTYAGDGLADPVQRLVGLNDMGHAPIGLVLAGAHGVPGASGGLLQVVDHAVDLFGGVGGTLGQRPALSGQYRKAAALFAGSGGRDGRIESQQVGRLGDARDHVAHGAYLLGITGQAGGRRGG